MMKKLLKNSQLGKFTTIFKNVLFKAPLILTPQHRFEKEFEEAYDLFEVQRVLNNAFSYDLVPSPAVIEKALRAARRVNDFPTAVRVFEGLKYKVENAEQYKAYLDELKTVREELGISLKEDLFPESVNEKHFN